MLSFFSSQNLTIKIYANINSSERKNADVYFPLFYRHKVATGRFNAEMVYFVWFFSFIFLQERTFPRTGLWNERSMQNTVFSWHRWKQKVILWLNQCVIWDAEVLFGWWKNCLSKVRLICVSSKKHFVRKCALVDYQMACMKPLWMGPLND